MYKQDRQVRNRYTIDLSITCPNGHSEIMLDNLTQAECQLEDLFAQGLLLFFDAVQIDDVSIARDSERGWPVTITLRAQGFGPLLPTHNLDLLIEEKLTCALSELFDSLRVERCAVL